MPIYRDDTGGLYWSMASGLTGERLRPSAIAMPESAWRRVHKVGPGRERAFARLAFGLALLISGPMLLGLAAWGLIGFAGLMMGLALAGLLALLAPALIMIGCETVAMDRPLRLVTPQPRALMLLEIVAGLAPAPALLMLTQSVAGSGGPYGLALWGLTLVFCLLGMWRVAVYLYRLHRAGMPRPVLG